MRETLVEPRPLRVVLLNWRDTTHPEGGGSERYVENVAVGLAAAGHDVTFFCAAHPGAPKVERRDGYRIVRRGGKFTVYAHAVRMLASGALGRPDVIVDVQNGIPFWSRLAVRCPVVVLVHHVHREQWGVVYGPATARLGWWLESRLAPRVYRRSRYVTVSEITRTELAALGVGPERVDVVHNGTAPAPATTTQRADAPRICVLGRLVPHKRVEHALQVAARLRESRPGLRVSVIGDGWWSDRLTAEAKRLGVDDITDFLGFVDERAKHEELARSWLMLAPSVKEGWGLTVVEAAQHQVPTIGYRSAGGLAESIVDGVTGLLADDLDGLTAATDELLADGVRRTALGRAAAARAATFTWDQTVRSWDALLRRTVGEATAERSARRVAAVSVGVPLDPHRPPVPAHGTPFFRQS
ncbi:glycosyltransferase family 1 protein [Jiangella aurantiaca]|uniref:Glycosyltransferase family 1 protein n=1 Tax=Jiangella aurantiaca TaxID=2530373 RepID=A0A4R5AIZ7_9ACTN|nr:glycosyltransferase family 4 protein [Jiangella aurantiaca]TDD71705.1 glycosyltransferase family 1 protein [Jiangella aurantiaca]